MSDHRTTLKEIQARTSTHACPECRKPTYCAMSAGKSANLCWCMAVPKDDNPQVAVGDVCLCKACLKPTA